MKKSINFDLDTNKLKEIYPNKNYTQAYDDIKKFLSKNGFEHRQGSGYISIEDMKNSKVVKIIQELNKKCDWLKNCCKTIDYYNVGKEYNGLEILKNSDNNDFSKNIDNDKSDDAMQMIREKLKLLKSKDIKTRKNN